MGFYITGAVVRPFWVVLAASMESQELGGGIERVLMDLGGALGGGSAFRA